MDKKEIIVVGCGEFGYWVARSLSEQKNGKTGKERYTVCVIDKNKKKLLERAEKAHFDPMPGNGLDERVLMGAEVNEAHLLIAAMETDEQNILCCTLAKNLNPAIETITLLHNKVYHDPDKRTSDSVWRNSGVDHIVMPEYLVARNVSRIMRFSNDKDIFTFLYGSVELVEIEVNALDDVAGKKISQVFSNHSVLCVVLERNSGKLEVIVPNGDTCLRNNDIIRIMGRPQDIFKFLGAHSGDQKDNGTVLIIGGGRTAGYLFDLIDRHYSRKRKLWVLEEDPQKCEELEGTGRFCMGGRVICGSGSDSDIFTEPGGIDLEAVEVAAIITDDDAANIFVALYSRKFPNIKTTAVRLSHTTDKLVDSFVEMTSGHTRIVRTRDIVAETIVKYVNALYDAQGERAVGGKNVVERMYEIPLGDDNASCVADENRIYAYELAVDTSPSFSGDKISALRCRLKDDVLLGCIRRQSGSGVEIIIPKGDDSVKRGDKLVIIAKGHKIKTIEDILR